VPRELDDEGIIELVVVAGWLLEDIPTELETVVE